MSEDGNPDADAIARLSRWYSGDIHDCLEALGLRGVLDGISLFGVLPPGAVICGPAKTVLFVPSAARRPQDLYHRAIDSVPRGGVLVVDASCAEGSSTGELMASGAKAHGAAATVVNGTVRDIAQVRELGYPLFARAVHPVSTGGKMEPVAIDVPLTIGGVAIEPGDIIFGDADGVVVVPRGLGADIAAAAETHGAREREARARILAGEPLQSIWPAA